MLTETVPHPLWSEIFDDCLILHAEHTMNASTFAGMVTASTLADPYTVVASSIGALKGPLHGGANEEVVMMLKQIGAPAQARAAVESRLEGKHKLMGFGHRVYKVKDPRATVLQELCMRLFNVCGTSPLYETAVAVEQLAGERLEGKRIYPNVDFYSGIVYDKMGIEVDLFTPLFAMARVSGWLAHWLEQLRENKLYRPDQIYSGEHNRIMCRSTDGKPGGGLFGSPDEPPQNHGRDHHDAAEQCIGHEFQHRDRLLCEEGY